MNYATLSSVLGVTEGSVRKRLKDLIKKGTIKVVAVPNAKEMGYIFMSIVAIQVRMSEITEVWQKLSQNPLVCQLAWVTGRYDLIAVVIAKSAEEFANFMASELSMISSVVRTETFVTLGMFKGDLFLADTTEFMKNLNVYSRKKSRNK